MWVWVAALTKPGVTPADVARKRKEWLEEGKDQQLKARCKSAQRFSLVGASPRQVFWLMETEDLSAVDLLAVHFGDVWDLHTHLVVPETIAEALER